MKDGQCDLSQTYSKFETDGEHFFNDGNEAFITHEMYHRVSENLYGVDVGQTGSSPLYRVMYRKMDDDLIYMGGIKMIDYDKFKKGYLGDEDKSAKAWSNLQQPYYIHRCSDTASKEQR